jgi:hypothetical protein
MAETVETRPEGYWRNYQKPLDNKTGTPYRSGN